MKIIEEFKKFISRGSVIDMAVGIIMGSAFTKIISSLVENVLTPFLSFITGRVDISQLAVTVNENLTIKYGMFLQSIIDFLLIAMSIFLIIKGINTAKDKLERKANEEKPPVPPSAEVQLLTEIRDLLKKE